MVDEGKPRDWEDIAFRLLGMYSLSFLFAQLSSKSHENERAPSSLQPYSVSVGNGKVLFLSLITALESFVISDHWALITVN